MLKFVSAALFGAMAVAVGASLGGVTTAQAQIRIPDATDPYGMLSPQNLSKKRPKAAVDVTGVWFPDGNKSENSFNFRPTQVTPKTQARLDELAAMRARGEQLPDDIGTCWPAGLPLIMTRVWPVQMVQVPTGIIMVAGFLNEVRWVYLDGRPHPDPEISVPGRMGHSIGHFEGKTLVIDTVNFGVSHHGMGGGIYIGEKAHLVERYSLSTDGKILTIENTWSDPEHWVGDYKVKKVYNREDQTDIVENHCLPDTNDHIAAAPRYGSK